VTCSGRVRLQIQTGVSIRPGRQSAVDRYAVGCAAVAELKRYVDGMGVGLLNRWFMMFFFRSMLIKRAYPIEEIRRMATEAGWIEPRIEISPVGFGTWMTK